jgi:hypothetical protein
MEKVVASAPGHVETVQALIFDGLSDAEVGRLSTLSTTLLTQLDKGIAAGTGHA